MVITDRDLLPGTKVEFIDNDGRTRKGRVSYVERAWGVTRVLIGEHRVVRSRVTPVAAPK